MLRKVMASLCFLLVFLSSSASVAGAGVAAEGLELADSRTFGARIQLSIRASQPDLKGGENSIGQSRV